MDAWRQPCVFKLRVSIFVLGGIVRAAFEPPTPLPGAQALGPSTRPEIIFLLPNRHGPP